jgi:hypothetical protein
LRVQYQQRPLFPLLIKQFPNIATTTERVGRAMINMPVAGCRTGMLVSADINMAGFAR